MRLVSKLMSATAACAALMPSSCADDTADGTDPDLLGTTVDVCTTTFGDIQTQAYTAADAQFVEMGVKGKWTISKTQVGTTNVEVARKTYTGKVYDFTATIDLGGVFTTGITNKLAAGEIPDANVFVACDYSKSAGSYATSHTAQLDGTGANDLCNTMKSKSDAVYKDALKHAAVSTQGFSPTAMTIPTPVAFPGQPAPATTSTTKLSLATSLKTTGSFTTENSEKQGWSSVKDTCKTWFSSAPTYSYPSLNADSTGTPSGTPEMAVCPDPYYLGVNEDPGIFWVDASSASFTANFTISKTPKTVVIGDDENKLYIDVPTITSQTASSRDTFVGIASKCGWDTEATDWWFADLPSTCSSLQTALSQSISQTAYDGLYVNKNPDTGNVGAVDLANGIMDLIAGIIVDAKGAAIQTDSTSELTIKSITVDMSKKRVIVVWTAVGC